MCVYFVVCMCVYLFWLRARWLSKIRGAESFVSVIGSLKLCFGTIICVRERGVKIAETLGLDGPKIVQNPT